MSNTQTSRQHRPADQDRAADPDRAADQDRPDSGRQPVGRAALCAAALAMACMVVYLPALRGRFIWDDDRHVSNNTALRSLDGLRRIWFVPRTTPQYYPLTHTSFWIDWHLFGDRTIGYHVVNVLLHAANALLLWRLLKMLAVPGAAAAAMLFALHPMQVETVAWISERKNLLSMLFYLAALIAWWRALDHRRPSIWMIASFALFPLAMLAKTVACSMPAAALVILWWKRGRIGVRDALPLLPFFAIGLGLAILTGRTERDYVGAAGPDWNLAPAQRILIAGRALWFYAAKLIWPARLTFSYPRWDVSTSQAWQFAFPIAAVAVVAALWFARRRIGRGAVAAVLIFGGVLVPALGFVNTYPMRYSFVADHFQYTAGAALIALIVAAGFRWAQSRSQSRSRSPSRSRQRVVVAASVAVALIFGALTWRQAHAYASPETLWRDTLAKNPRSWMAANNLAALLSQAADADIAAGRDDDALQKLNEADRLFEQADALRPQHEMLPLSWGDVLMKLARPRDAIGEYESYLARTPMTSSTRRSIAIAHDRIGEAYVQLGRRERAAEQFARSIQIDPGVAETWLHLAAVRDEQGRLDAAIAAYRQYLALAGDDSPTKPEVLTWMGMLLGQSGRFAEASDAFSRAIAIDPNNADAKRGLAAALAIQQRRATTAQTATTAPASQPTSAP